MGKPIIYGLIGSPPVRTVLLTAHAINLDFEFKDVNFLNKEHLSAEYLQKNPQHTIPLLEDGGKFIWDSHAISTYLIGKYAQGDSLYPKDLFQSALVDQRLHFDSGILFPRLVAVARKIYIEHNPNISQELLDNLYEAYDFVEKFLETNTYMVGDSLTVADLSCLSSVTSMEYHAPILSEKYPKLAAWMKRLEKLPYYYEANGKGNDARTEMFNKILESIK